jgi:hypothetical protein
MSQHVVPARELRSSVLPRNLRVFTGDPFFWFELVWLVSAFALKTGVKTRIIECRADASTCRIFQTVSLSIP